MPINPVHAVSLPGEGMKVLIVQGAQRTATPERSMAAVYDVATGQIQTRELAWNLFCSGMSHLPSGEILITGGTKGLNPYTGEAYSIVYNPFTDQFTQVGELYDGRWYPTNTVFADPAGITSDKTLVIAGKNRQGGMSRFAEIFDAETRMWEYFPVPFKIALYPRGHLLPNGRVFYTAPDWLMREFHPATRTWRTMERQGDSVVRNNGSSVLLPLSPPYTEAQILVAGGSNRASAWIVHPLENPVLSEPIAAMARARQNANATLLPDGTVFINGGSANLARQAELFNPADNTWRSLATAKFIRGYHSVALLLPDGRVLTMGGQPNSPENYVRTIEIYSPPYLFSTTPRPIITSVSGGPRYGRLFTVQTPDAAGVDKVMLMSLATVTHAFDMGMRAVELSFAQVAGELQVQAPPHGAIAPEGYYHLFLLRAGVPSVAASVFLTY
jgi:hypothetical protein